MQKTYQFHDFQESNTDEKYKSVIRDIITESQSYKEMINKLISYKRSILPTITEDSLGSLNLVFETFYLISSIPEEKDDILEKGFLFAVKEKIPCKKNGIRYYMNGEKMA